MIDILTFFFLVTFYSPYVCLKSDCLGNWPVDLLQTFLVLVSNVLNSPYLTSLDNKIDAHVSGENG